MSNFVGHIEARLDTKNRLVFPAAFKKQLIGDARDTFILKKDIYEACLVLYPKDTWDRIVEELHAKLNPYNRKHNILLRKFFAETAEVSLDANNRLLLPKRLTDKAQIERDILLIGLGDKIELWSPLLFEQMLISDEEFAELTENILAGDSEQ